MGRTPRLWIMTNTANVDELNRKLRYPYSRGQSDSRLPTMSSIGSGDIIRFLLEYHVSLRDNNHRNVVESIRRYVASGHYRNNFAQPYNLGKDSLENAWIQLRKVSIFHYLLRWGYGDFWPKPVDLRRSTWMSARSTPSTFMAQKPPATKS
jgi:hypothetical protein